MGVLVDLAGPCCYSETHQQPAVFKFHTYNCCRQNTVYFTEKKLFTPYIVSSSQSAEQQEASTSELHDLPPNKEPPVS